MCEAPFGPFRHRGTVPFFPVSMSSRWFNIAVVVLWATTMGWLVKEKVLPPLVVGDPPSYIEIVKAQNREPPVAWEVFLNGRRIGWALTETRRQKTDLTEIHGRAHFDTLPIAAVIPGWLQPLSRLIGKPVQDLQMDGRSELLIDPFGRLLRFESTVRLEPWNEMVSMRGMVEGGQLQFVVRSGELSFNYEVPLPPKALLSDALSPQSCLPGLHVGQKWSVPIFNPLWPTTGPIEVIRATVEGTQPILWNGGIEDAWLVVYRRDLGSNPGESQKPQGSLWVRRDGAVLRQEVVLSSSTIQFVRMSDREAASLVDSIGPRWWSFDGRPAVRKRP
jgi:hypothetical protein